MTRAFPASLPSVVFNDITVIRLCCNCWLIFTVYKNVVMLLIQNSGKGESLNCNTLLISAKTWSNKRYFQRLDTSATFRNTVMHNSFLSRIRYDQCVVGVFATFGWMVWSRVTVYFNRRQVNDFFRRCVNVLSPFVTLSSVFASMSSCYTQDANCWQQRRLSWWNYGKTLATPLLTARKHWRSLTMT